jgi:hypothetical protein
MFRSILGRNGQDWQRFFYKIKINRLKICRDYTLQYKILSFSSRTVQGPHLTTQNPGNPRIWYIKGGGTPG